MRMKRDHIGMVGHGAVHLKLVAAFLANGARFDGNQMMLRIFAQKDKTHLTTSKKLY